MTEIENRVKKSGIITLDLQQYIPDMTDVMQLDIAVHLFQGLILREKDFRAALKETDWSQYDDKIVLVYCSADAIIPDWAYMLLASYLSPVCSDMFYGNSSHYQKSQVLFAIQNIKSEEYSDQRVIIKGCGSETIDAAAYFEISKKLLPAVRTLMYGEPCSTVPIYKRKK